MVRLVYTINILIFLSACSTSTHVTPIESSKLRLEKDRIRENEQAIIMHRTPSVDVDPDVALIRKLFTTEYENKPYVFTEQYTPKLHLYTNKPISLGDAITTMKTTLGYTAVYTDGVDKEQTVILQNMALSLKSLTESIEYQTNTLIHVFPESKVIIVSNKF